MRACWYESDTSSTLQKMSKNSGAMNSHRVSLRIRRRSLKFFTVRAYVCKAHFTLAFMVAATYIITRTYFSRPWVCTQLRADSRGVCMMQTVANWSQKSTSTLLLDPKY